MRSAGLRGRMAGRRAQHLAAPFGRGVIRLVLAAAAIAADLDLLFALHRGPTAQHRRRGLSSSRIVALSRHAQRRSPGYRRGCGLRLSHAARLARHRRIAPIGIMALWPFSREYYESPATSFTRSRDGTGCRSSGRSNLIALLRELLILRSDHRAGCVLPKAAVGPGFSPGVQRPLVPIR